MSILQRRSLGCGSLQPIMLIVLWMTTVSSTPSFQCPEMAVLNSSLDLTCCVERSFNANSYTTPAGRPAGACDLTGRFCRPHSNFNASVINQTCSVLTIHRIEQSHEGDWKCGVDADAPDLEASCHVSVSERPTCYVTSDKNVSLLSEGDTLKLTMNLSRSDCPESVQLQLRTGNISSAITTGTDIKDETPTIVFNVTNSHAGEVSLIYTCSGSSWNLPCGGIKRLVLGKQINITTPPTQLTGHPTTDGQDTDSSRFGVELCIIPIVFVVAVVVVVVAIVFIRKRRKKKEKHRNKENEDDTEASALRHEEDTL